jgi:hypothetical protein
MATYVVKDMFASWLCQRHCPLEDGGKTRFLSEDHRDDFLRENSVDDDLGNEKVRLDFVREKSIVATLTAFEDRLRQEDYTDNAVVVLELDEGYDGTLDFVRRHLQSLDYEDVPYEITVCKVPMYVHRSSQVDTMFDESLNFGGYDDYFFVDEEDAFCFIWVQKKGTLLKRKFEDDEEKRETKRKLHFEEEEEEEHSGAYKVEVDVDPNAIDDEKRVMPPMDLYITDYDRVTCDALMKKSTSLLMSGKHMHFFRVNVGTPPMVRMYTIDRDTGEVMKKFLPLTEVVIDRNIVTKYQDQNTIMQAPKLKQLMNAFLHEFDADFDGDSIVGLQEVYELFTCYCIRQHGYPLRGVEMHCWFFFAVSDLYSGWIVDRGGKHYIRCMSLDLDAAYQHCLVKGWTLRSLPYL